MDHKERLVVSLDFNKTPYDGDKRFITPYLIFLNKEIDSLSEGVKVLDESIPTPEVDPHDKAMVEYDEQQEKGAFLRHLQAVKQCEQQNEIHLASVEANLQATAINEYNADGPQPSIPPIPVPPILPVGVHPGPFVYARNVAAAQRLTATERAIEKVRKVSAAALKRMEDTLGYGIKTKHVKLLSDTTLHPRVRLVRMHAELKKLMESNHALISNIKNDVRLLRQATDFRDLQEIIGEIDKFDFQIASMNPEQKYRESDLITIVTGDKTHDPCFTAFKLDWTRRERNANRECPPRSLTWDELKEEVNLHVDTLPGASSTTALSAIALAAVAEKDDLRAQVKELQAQVMAVQSASRAGEMQTDRFDNYDEFSNALDSRPPRQAPLPQRLGFRSGQPFGQRFPYTKSTRRSNSLSNPPLFNQQSRQYPRYASQPYAAPRPPQNIQQHVSMRSYPRPPLAPHSERYGGASTQFRQGQGGGGARAYAVSGEMSEEEEHQYDEQWTGAEAFDTHGEEDYVTFEEPQSTNTTSSSSSSNDTSEV